MLLILCPKQPLSLKSIPLNHDIFNLAIITRLVYLLFLLGSTCLYGAKEPAEDFSDWISESAAVSLCGGHYEPLVTGPVQEDDFFRLPIELSANESAMTFEGKSILEGFVALKQGNRYLNADKVIVERSPSTHDFERLFAMGHIHFYAPGLNIYGESAEYDHLHRYLQIEGTSYRLYDRHARGKAKHIDINKDIKINLEGASYTTCSPHRTTWLLHAQKITLSPKKGRAVAKNIWLELYNVPIFYFPYFNYPIDNKRHSGILFPSYGTSSNSGNEVTIPYYWNIAPNYDLSLAGRWLSERGTEGQSTFRYLFNHSEGTVQWYFLPNDRKYAAFAKNTLSSPPLPLNDPRMQGLNGSDNRYAFNYRHTTRWGNRWQMNILFDRVSDDNYFVDLGNDINTASTIHLPQQANLSYFGDNWSHFFNIEEYQVLEPLSKPINEEIYKRQPQWVFQTLYPNQILNLTFGLNGETVNFNRLPNLLTDEPVTVGQRLHLRPSMSLPIQESWYYITPRLQEDWLYYSLHLGKDATSQSMPSHPNRIIPLYDIDSGLFFERDLHYKHHEFIQTIEPRVYYLYVPFRDQHQYPDFDSGIMNFSYAQLFRDNRFSGRDRIADANQITLSMTSRLLPHHGGQEWLRASIGQIFYFQRRHVSLCEQLDEANTNCFEFEDPTANSHHSTLITQAELHASPIWTGGFFLEWDSFHQQTKQASFNLQYHPSFKKIINLNYYWLAHDIAQVDFATGELGRLHQADISFFWPLKLHWQFLSRFQYDLEERQTIEVLGGLEYDTCCLALQLVGMQYRQSTNSIYPKYANAVLAQVVFKGLSSIGKFNNPDSKLKQKIPGYLPLYDRQQIGPRRQIGFPPQDIPLF
ncbi:MAG: LPS-assembly protein LptD [Candidatus Berkiellales bacterium]